jgi:hypothetical protein
MVMDDDDDDDEEEEEGDYDDDNTTQDEMDLNTPPSQPPHRKIDEIRYLHKVILASNSEYFSRVLNNTTTMLDVVIDFLGYDEDVIKPLIHEFFRLFYVNVIDDSSFENYAFVHKNILSLHKLALHFGFNPLLQYTEQKLISKLDASFFPILCDFCINKKDNSINVSSKHLFKRVIEWLEYCHDKDMCSFSHNHFITVSPFFATTAIAATVTLSTKDAIKAILSKNVRDFHLYDTLSQSYHYNTFNRSFSIQNYARICTRCIHDHTRNEWPIVRGYYVIPLHSINYGDKSLHFRLKICQSTGIMCQLDVHKERDSQHPSSSSQSARITSAYSDQVVNQLSLLTKTGSDLVYQETGNVASKNRPSIDFPLPQENECFVSKCHKCLTSHYLTFIIKYNVTIFDHDFQ